MSRAKGNRLHSVTSDASNDSAIPQTEINCTNLCVYSIVGKEEEEGQM